MHHCARRLPLSRSRAGRGPCGFDDGVPFLSNAPSEEFISFGKNRFHLQVPQTRGDALYLQDKSGGVEFCEFVRWYLKKVCPPYIDLLASARYLAARGRSATQASVTRPGPYLPWRTMCIHSLAAVLRDNPCVQIPGTVVE